MDRWLSDSGKKTKENKKVSSYSEESIEEMKKRKIRELINKEKRIDPQDKKESNKIENEFLRSVLEFKEWINSRNYIKGDLDKIEIWIINLYQKLNINQNEDLVEKTRSSKNNLMEMYRDIPPDFLEESIRIALNKKLRGKKLTGSNKYYIKKLKNIILEKLKEVKYYELIKELLDI